MSQEPRERCRPKVISLVGPANSGKTQTVCRLVGWLAERGLRVGVVKHSHHRLPAVSPEAAAYRQAGARAFAAAAPRVLQITCFPPGDPDPAPLLTWLNSQLDVVLVEGYKGGDLPKILLTGPGLEEVLPDRRQVVALISPQAGEGPLPVFHPDDLEGLGRFILTYLGMPPVLPSPGHSSFRPQD